MTRSGSSKKSKPWIDHTNSYISIDSNGHPKVHHSKNSLNEDYPSELKKDKEQQKKKGGSPGSKGKTGNGGKSSHSKHTGNHGSSGGGSGKSCGDPGCGVTHYCQMHYSQAVQPMGYSGFANTPVYQSGGAYCQPRRC